MSRRLNRESLSLQRVLSSNTAQRGKGRKKTFLMQKHILIVGICFMCGMMHLGEWFSVWSQFLLQSMNLEVISPGEQCSGSCGAWSGMVRSFSFWSVWVIRVRKVRLSECVTHPRWNPLWSWCRLQFVLLWQTTLSVFRLTLQICVSPLWCVKMLIYLMTKCKDIVTVWTSFDYLKHILYILKRRYK